MRKRAFFPRIPVKLWKNGMQKEALASFLVVLAANGQY